MKKHFSQEARERLAEAKRNNWADPEFRARRKAARTGKCRGENNPCHILTERDVRNIRDLCEENVMSKQEIAKFFSVSRSTVQAIYRRTVWRWLE